MLENRTGCITFDISSTFTRPNKKKLSVQTDERASESIRIIVVHVYEYSRSSEPLLTLYLSESITLESYYQLFLTVAVINSKKAILARENNVRKILEELIKKTPHNSITTS